MFFVFYVLFEEFCKPITGQYYITNCVSWVPKLTLLDLNKQIGLMNALLKHNSFIHRGFTLFIWEQFFSRWVRGSSVLFKLFCWVGVVPLGNPLFKGNSSLKLNTDKAPSAETKVGPGVPLILLFLPETVSPAGILETQLKIAEY